MGRLSRIFIMLLTMTTVFISACEKEGPAERAGEKVDEAVEEVGDEVEEAGDELDDAVD